MYDGGTFSCTRQSNHSFTTILILNLVALDPRNVVFFPFILLFLFLLLRRRFENEIHI